ncbi:MAG: glycoside hydrolase [Burkholderiales bacterium PBB5]|nr:MAG: glycoside hydrolase [Burkholderiales bacterium PBB5]
MTERHAPAILVDDLPAARRSLRVAVVTETYPPEVNGVAMTIARVVEGLRERGHDLQLVRPRQDKRDEADRSEGFHEVLLRGLPIPRYPHLKMGLPAKRALVEQWAWKRPDVVHIATEGPLGWSALQAATRLRLPVVSDFRTNFHAYSRHYGLAWLHKPILAYLRKFHNRTQVTMVPTDGLRRELTGSGFVNVSVVARGVDTGLFNPERRSAALRATWGAGPDTLVVLCVGRLAPEKNLGALITAFEAMRAVHPDAKLVLVGDGPARKELEAACPGALFAGARRDEDLAAHYASADAFVFPSLSETFGNVTPEAMASGLPMVAYDYAAAGRLIQHGQNGLLAPTARSDAFVQRAVDLARDRHAGRLMGAAARETALLHSWDRIYSEIESVYLSCLRASPVPRGTAVLHAEPRLR